jgi:ATP-dependent RNA helicase DDX35
MPEGMIDPRTMLSVRPSLQLKLRVLTGTDDTVVSLEGHMFPVEVCYLKEPVSDYCEAAVNTVFNIHMKEPAGDILVFLTGREEIDTVLQQVADRAQE